MLALQLNLPPYDVQDAIDCLVRRRVIEIHRSGEYRFYEFVPTSRRNQPSQANTIRCAYCETINCDRHRDKVTRGSLELALRNVLL